MLHYVIDPISWDDYFPDKSKDNPFPRTFNPKNRPVSLPRGGPWQYVETDWAALDVSDEEYGGDWLVTQWIGEQLNKPADKPFFLACGIYRPHEPWFVPKKYFEPFPLESIQIPPGYKQDDLQDLPPAAKRIASNRYFAHIQEQGQKFTGWRACSRVPFVIRVPKGAPGLMSGTQAGGVCDRPVSLVDLFGTLTDLCGLPRKTDISNRSLVPLLKDPTSEWPHAAITHLDHPQNYAISTERWRYIHFVGGQEELYDIVSDPYEWTNLVNETTAEVVAKLVEMRWLAPTEIAPESNP